MDTNLNAAYDACNSFNNKLKDTIMGLINANSDRKREIDGLRADHDQLRKDHNSFEGSATRENDLRCIDYKVLFFIISKILEKMRLNLLRKEHRKTIKPELMT